MRKPKLHQVQTLLIFILANSFVVFSLAQDEQTKVDEELKAKFFTAKRVVFLGDSNTNAGGFINQIEAILLSNGKAVPELINLGLPSETCCGLSEPIHPFPRPNVQERLTRVIEKTKPDFAFACYGMNDGIYHPFSEERFKAFQDGVRKIIAAHADAKIPLVLLTPPPFDPLPMSKSGKLVDKDAKEFSWKNIYKNYDTEVIKKYSDWMLTLNEPNCVVIDTHTPFNKHMTQLRISKPDFAYSNDGVHFDAAGHKVFAGIVLAGMDYDDEPSDNQALLKLVKKRHSITHPAWLTEVGHLRPGVKPGLSLTEANEKIAPITAEINKEVSTPEK